MAELSPLRRRMIEDMTVRNLSPATQRSYLAAVSKLCRHSGQSPDQLGLEEVRAFQVHLVATGMSWPALNQIVCALRFFYGVTLAHAVMYGRPPLGKGQVGEDGAGRGAVMYTASDVRARRAAGQDVIREPGSNHSGALGCAMTGRSIPVLLSSLLPSLASGLLASLRGTARFRKPPLGPFNRFGRPWRGAVRSLRHA